MTKRQFRMHQVEDNVIVEVRKDGTGQEFCNTLNSLGNQDDNAHYILRALRHYTEETNQ